MPEHKAGDEVAIPSYLMQEPGEYFAARCPSDSLEDIGIFEGDLLIIKKGVAEIGTLAFFSRKNDPESIIRIFAMDAKGYFYLKAANKKYGNEPLENWEQTGKVVALIREKIITREEV